MKNKLYLLILLLPYLAIASTVGDRVWLDKNQDWEQNQGEPGLANIKINLYNANNQKIKSTITDKNGNYKFENIENKQYFIEVEVPDGYKIVTQKRMEFWENEDLDILDFGLNKIFLPIAKGMVWNDKNKDWKLNNSEKSLSNITIELFDEKNNKISSTKTDKNGYFSFKIKDIKDKIHFVEVVVPTGYKIVTDKRVEFGGEYIPDLNFGLLTPLTVNKPITRAELETMIANGDDVTKVNTSKITDMSRLFYKNSTFNQDISKWDTSNVTNMSEMFAYTYKFNQPIGSWNVSKVTNMSNMFTHARKFNQPIGSWNVSKVKNMSKLFYFADSFNQDISSWNTSNVRNMNEMFARAYKFNQPIGSWNVSKVRNMSQMFSGYCPPFQHHINFTPFNQDLSKWDVSNVKTMYKMFYASYINQDLTKWNVSNVTSWKNIFEIIYLRYKPGWSRPGQRRMEAKNIPTKFLNNTASEEPGEKEKFYGDYSKPTTDLSKPITIGRLREMIANNQDVTKVNTSEITNMSELFDGNSNFNQDISNWDTSKVTDMSRMFRYAHEFNQDIGKWDVSNVTNMESMFSGYYEYNGHYYKIRKNKFNQDLSNWDVSSVTNMIKMFAVSNFNQNISNWNVSNVTKWHRIFCSKLWGSHNNGIMKKENSPEKLFDLKGEI